MDGGKEMKIRSQLALVLGSALLYISTAYTAIPNNNQPTTFLGPNLKVSAAYPLSSISAYSIAGELGLKNIRAGGTFAWRLVDNQRLKLSAEYLRQEITFPFFVGNTDQWVQQGAIGADYQYELFGYRYAPQFDLNAYYSHAPSKRLGTATGTFVNQSGITQNFTDVMHIAGSNAGGISPGVTIEPWMGGQVGVQLNYDNVQYNKEYAPSENANGLGGTVHLSQALMNSFLVNASASVRQPFNNYTAAIMWTNVPYFGNWMLGVDSAYTVGKNTLPNTYDISLTASYSADPPAIATTIQRQAAIDDLVAWTSKPAVYMPQVLAIPDQKLITSCAQGIPAFIGSIESVTGLINKLITVNTAGNFTGQNLTFAIASISPKLNPLDTVTINSTTGVVSIIDNTGVIYNIVVSASNQCGSASSNAFSIITLG